MFLDGMLFNKKNIMKIPTRRKSWSLLYVIGLFLGTSLILLFVKQISFDYAEFTLGLSNWRGDSSTELIYKDNVTMIRIDEQQLIYDGQRMASMDELQTALSLESTEDLLLFIEENKSIIYFILLIYQYISSLKYLLIFILLFVILSLVRKKYVNNFEEIDLAQAMTYTSTILTIPILISLVLRFLQLKDNLVILVLVSLSVILEVLFSKYYVQEKEVENEKMVA